MNTREVEVAKTVPILDLRTDAKLSYFSKPSELLDAESKNRCGF